MMRRLPRPTRGQCCSLLTGLVWLGITACNLSDVTDASETLDGEVINPDVVESIEGARLIYLGAIARFNSLSAVSANEVARFTDEVAMLPSRSQDPVDMRFDVNEPVMISERYNLAQSTRVQMEQAIQLLQEYYTGTNRTMEAHMYGLLGMVHLILADDFCSGIPLSESKWGGEFLPGKGYPTDSVYQRAIYLFDLGLNLNTDSVAVQTLLRVGKARALSALGRYDEAVTIVKDVHDEDNVWIQYGSTVSSSGSLIHSYLNGLDTSRFRILNHKGQNGLVWIADDPGHQDMRIPLRIFDTTYIDGTRDTIYRNPIKPSFFFTDRTFRIASGEEARLIEAEAALAANDIPTFIAKINVVRRRYKTFGGVPLIDTMDPGTEAERIDLLFRERAYTLYQTGRRLGDYRRLVRQYLREPNDVYPKGLSEGSKPITYGNNFVFAPERPGQGRESQYNPHYYECDSYVP